MKTKPAQQTLIELRGGEVMNEMSLAIKEAVMAAHYHRKPATVTLTLTIKPMGTQGVSDALEMIADVDTKLPKQPNPSTLMFIDADGNPSPNHDPHPQPRHQHVRSPQIRPCTRPHHHR